jgi:hypothetical protein
LGFRFVDEVYEEKKRKRGGFDGMRRENDGDDVGRKSTMGGDEENRRGSLSESRLKNVALFSREKNVRS